MPSIDSNSWVLAVIMISSNYKSDEDVFMTLKVCYRQNIYVCKETSSFFDKSIF